MFSFRNPSLIAIRRQKELTQHQQSSKNRKLQANSSSSDPMAFKHRVCLSFQSDNSVATSQRKLFRHEAESNVRQRASDIHWQGMLEATKASQTTTAKSGSSYSILSDPPAYNVERWAYSGGSWEQSTSAIT